MHLLWFVWFLYIPLEIGHQLRKIEDKLTYWPSGCFEYFDPVCFDHWDGKLQLDK